MQNPRRPDAGTYQEHTMQPTVREFVVMLDLTRPGSPEARAVYRQVEAAGLVDEVQAELRRQAAAARAEAAVRAARMTARRARLVR
jgi:hypothetical protein